jgi:hypothetical protein
VDWDAGDQAWLLLLTLVAALPEGNTPMSRPVPMGVIKDSDARRARQRDVLLRFMGQPFDHDASRDAAFHALSGTAVNVHTMFGSFALNHRAGTNYAVAEFPYEGNLRMTVVLPAAGQFESVRSQVSAAWLEQESVA